MSRFLASYRSVSIASILLTALPLASTFAEVITVDDDGKADFASIQAAVYYASDGDVVEIASGTYYPNATIDTLGKAITLRGAVDDQGGPTTIIDGQDSIGVLLCTSSEGTDTIFENLIITGGSAYYGGGMFNYGSSPTVTNCTFTGNSATGTYGGGVYNYLNGSPTLTDCTFTNNSANKGGGVANYGAGVILVNCTFTGNSAARGGGMYNESSSSPMLTNCTFTGNSADNDDGGGMFNYNSSPMLTDCTFTDNSARSGGGMYNRDSSPTLTDCVFTNNLAGYLNDNQNFDAENILTYYFGGGMLNLNSSPVLTRCTFNGNFANLDGGGMYSTSNSSPTLTDTIVCSNTPDQVYGPWNDNGGNAIATSCDCPADINGDGVINGADLTFVFGFWGTNDAVADVNNDGVVDGADLTVVLDAWGACSQ